MELSPDDGARLGIRVVSDGIWVVSGWYRGGIRVYQGGIRVVSARVNIIKNWCSLVFERFRGSACISSAFIPPGVLVLGDVKIFGSFSNDFKTGTSNLEVVLLRIDTM